MAHLGFLGILEPLIAIVKSELKQFSFITQTTMRSGRCFLENTKVKVINVNHTYPDYGIGLEHEGGYHIGLEHEGVYLRAGA